jgi:hypothetical protein
MSPVQGRKDLPALELAIRGAAVAERLEDEMAALIADGGDVELGWLKLCLGGRKSVLGTAQIGPLTAPPSP